VAGGRNQVLLTVNGLRAIGQRAALLAYPDGELRRTMGETGFAHVRERFSVERMVAETAAVYSRVAGRPRAADTENLPARD
jgi:hypothetical protein